MTNQSNNTNQQSSPSQAAKPAGKSLLGGGIGGWFGALLGKPRSSAKVPPIPEAPSATPTPASELSANKVPDSFIAGDPKAGDSVVQDVENLKKIVGKFSGKVASKVGPVVKEGATDSTKAAQAFVKSVDKKYITLILRIFFALVFVIAAIFIGTKLLGNRSGEENEGEMPIPNRDGTPSPIFYNPPKASVYATEEYILSLEEEINIITQEISRASLREIELNPPNLDFNIVFKE